LDFAANGNLVIKASASSSPKDFDFLVGKWKMHHRRLNKVWSQAFSPDNGKTWEWNWYNVSVRVP